jgi:hypothetical protein
VPAVGWEEMDAQRAVVGVAWRLALLRPGEPTALDDQHDRWVGVAAGRPHVLAIRAPLLRITVRDACIADLGGARLDRPHHPEPHAAGDPAPGTIA